MTAGDSRLAGVAFALLTLSVVANLLAFQEPRRGATFETAAIGPRTLTGEAGASGLPRAVAAAPQTSGIGPRGPASAEAAASTAEIVRGIQRELNTRGYDAGPPDGAAGLVTRAAIMAYEHDYGFALTGTPGQELLSQIVLGTSAPSAGRRQSASDVSAEAGSVVRMTEQALSSLGYQPGKADGKLSDQTARAIREFELDQKLAETGRISGPLMSRLLRLQGQTPQATPKPARAAQR